ncbi:MAG: hypothetical protein VXW31_01085 [Planctomycetota bacterium]|nr:hypothetical protein [Planctomycetota bacterium]
MIAVLPLALLTVAAPDIAPNPRNRSAMDLAPDRATTEVAMRAEVVELVLHEDFAEVRAVFDMEHTGDEPETLEVGFPTEARPLVKSVREGLGYGDILSGGGVIYAFSASVDGVKVEATRKEVDEDDPREVHRKWICWPMTFEPKQRCRVEVRYEVETKDDFFLEQRSPLRTRELIYVLKTGRGWHDTIGSARILLRAADGFGLDRVGPVDPAPTTKRKGEWEWLIEDFEPDEDIRVGYRVFQDSNHAVERLTAELAKQPDDAVRILELAENNEVLGNHAAAAAGYARIADWSQEKPGKPRYRRPRLVDIRLRNSSAAYLAARNFAAAGDLERAREPWARRAVDEIDELIQRTTNFIERYKDNPKVPLDDSRARLERARERRAEMARLIESGRED